MDRSHKGDNGFSQANDIINYPRSIDNENCTIKDDKTNRRNRSQFIRREYEGNKSKHEAHRDGHSRANRKRHTEHTEGNVKRRRTKSPSSRQSHNDRNHVDSGFLTEARPPRKRLEGRLSSKKEKVIKKLQKLLKEDSSDIVLILLSEKSTFREILSTAPRANICVHLNIVRILIHSFDCELAKSMVCSVIDEIKDTNYLEELTSVVQYRIHEEMLPCLELLENIIKCINRIININPCEKIYTLGICNYMKKTVQQISEETLEDAEMSKLKNMISIVKDIKSQCIKPNKPESKIGRHELNCPNFRQFSIYPTTADIHAEIDPYLRPIKVKEEYANLDQYLDNHFRLLREDFMIPFRDGIRRYINGNVGTTIKKLNNIRVYENARILNPVCCESGVNYLIAFDVSKLKHVRWASSNRLKYGSILCLSSDRFSTCCFAKVDDSNYKYRAIGHVTVKFVDDIISFGSLSGKLFQFTESNVYFESVCHVLACLQRKNELPLTDYLLKCRKDVLPPKYLRDRSDWTVDLKPILKITKDRSSEMEFFPEMNPANINLLVDPWPDASHLCLNETQSKAVKSALTREFCVIQGPPGCGKTYVGLKIVDVLMCNQRRWTGIRSSPILLLCYTNHALDQFMEGILNFSKRIIRIGGRSRSDVLKPYNLKTIRESNRRYKTFPFHLYTLRKEARLEKELVAEKPPLLFKALRQHILNERCLKREMGEQIFTQFKVLEQQRKQNNYKYRFLGKSVMVEWLGIHKMYEDICSNANAEYSELNTEMLVENKDLESSGVYVHGIGKEDEALNLDELFYENESKDEKFRKQKLVNRIRRRLLCSNEEISAQENIFILTLSTDKRWQFYRSWVNSFCVKQMPSLVNFSKKYNNACQICEEERQLEDKCIMQDASLIGMTTSCGAKYQAVLNEIKPKIIIVEEAAEIVESHIIANLAKDCEQLILIGDHKQLRPKLNVYELEKDYNLEISLFERMVKNGVAFECLDTQHRMRPEIAKPLQLIYDRLKHHESVFHFDNIKGVGKNFFMINHNQHESNNYEISSFKNVHEAKFVAAFYKYLRQQGYSHTDITVLTPYKEQLHYLKTIFSQSNLLDGALLNTVDDYQGKENRILIISLVRSNDENRIGFLKEENRVCVALSRAQEGLFVVGNFDNLKKSSNLWKKITEQVQIDGCFGSVLPLYCQNHPDTKINVEKALDFQKAPNGGCRKLCVTHLPCGHSCDRYCHLDDKDHTEAKCNANIMVTFPDCPHEMSFRCGTKKENQICSHKCGLYLRCGHICSKRCGEICNPCAVMVDVLSDNCDAEIYDSEMSLLNSCTKGHLSDCEEMCGKILACGHVCSGKCNECVFMNARATCVIHKKCSVCKLCKKPCVSKWNYDGCEQLVSQLPAAESRKYLTLKLCTGVFKDDFTVGNISDIIKEIHRSLDLYILDQFHEILSIRYVLNQYIATIRSCVDYNDTERNRTFESLRHLCDETNSQVDNVHFTVVEHDVQMIICKRLHCNDVLLTDYPAIDIKKTVKVHFGIGREIASEEITQKKSGFRKTHNTESTIEGFEQTSIFCENSNYRPNGANDETLIVKCRTRASTEKYSINDNSELSDVQYNGKENDNEIEKEKEMSLIPKKTLSCDKSSEDENQVVLIRTIKIPFAKINGIKECSCRQLSRSKRTRPESIDNETEKQERDNKIDKLRSDKNNFIEENNPRKRKNNEERTEKFENTSNQKRQKHHSSKKETTFLDPSDLRHRLQKKRETGTVDIRLEQTKEQPTVIAESTATMKIEEDEEEDEDWIVLDEVFG